MLPITNLEETITPTTDSTLVQHSKMPQWGLALLAWERESKRGYQFEDGELRIFKKGYFRLLKPADRPRDETARALAALNTKLGRRDAAKRLGTGETVVSLKDQLDYFFAAFPKGLTGVKWAKKHRGLDANKCLKRHRAPLIKLARTILGEDRLKAKLDAGEALSVVAELWELFGQTALVTKAQTRGFDRMSDEKAEYLIGALRDVLWGEGGFDARFQRYVGALRQALGRTPSWQLATALLTLTKPEEHICVKPSAFKRQAAWMAPHLKIDSKPSAVTYARLRDMAQEIGRRLETNGSKPRDLVDVYDFVDLTLRPKAVKEIVAKAAADTEAADAGEVAVA